TVIFRDNRDLEILAWCKVLFYKHLKPIYWQAMQLGVSKKDVYHTFKFNQLKYWVATLPSMKQDVEQKTNINPKKIKVIPLGINLERFTKINLNKAESRAFFKLPETGFMIGCIGRIDPQKGQA